LVIRGTADGSNGPCDDPTWKSTSNRVATVTAKGKVIAKGIGVASIVAQCAVGQGTATVQVVGNDDFVSRPAAFPGAQGWGAQALMTCDRSQVQVIPVTSLEDSGPGTLREAIDRARDDVLSLVTFDVSGVIELERMIEVNKSCLYVAGQTAPGGGITIRAPDRAALWLRGRSLHDVVFRYLRIRNGTHAPEAAEGIGMVIGSGTRVVVDHLSFSWSGQLLTLYRYPDTHGWSGDVKNVSVQRTLFAEPFATGPLCYSTKGETGIDGDGNGVPPWYEVEEITFHHNAAIHCSHRAPMVVSRETEVINNIVYNWNIAAMHTEGRKPYVDYIGNYFRAGPATRTGVSYAYEFSHKFEFNRPGGHKGNEPDAYAMIGVPAWDGRLGPGLYLEGNVGPNNVSGDNPGQWRMTSKYKGEESEGIPEVYYSDVQYSDEGLMPVSVAGVSLRRQSRMAPPPIPVVTQSAEQAWQSLVEQGEVGANRRVSCSGTWVSNVDAVDRRVLEDARNGTGPKRDDLIRHEDEVGGYPDIDPGSKCSDSDSDGMPDAFEDAYGLDNSAADASADADGDGYSNIEEYLNGTSAS
jgi:hypothetical protein